MDIRTPPAQVSDIRGRIYRILHANLYVRATGLLILATIAILLAWRILGHASEIQFASFLPLHTFLETCSIVVSVMVFVMSRQVAADGANRNMLLLGTAFLGVAVLDFMHAMSYAGMPAMVTPSGPEKAINFWLAARLLAAGALVAAATMSWHATVPRRTAQLAVPATLAVIGAITWIVLYRPQSIPRTFIPGQGLTGFKIVAEWIIIALSLIAAIGFFRHAEMHDRQGSTGVRFDPIALMSAAVVTALAEVFFTIYIDVNGLSNVLGHIYKVIAAWLIYRGLVAVNLQDIEARFHLALDAGKIGTWTWETASGTLDLDPRARSMFWLMPHQPAFVSTFEKLVHPEDRPRRRAAMDRALTPHGAGDYQAEFRIVHPVDGRERWIASHGKTDFEEGQPRRLMGVVRDVTQRRRAEEMMRHSEAKFSGIVAIAADAIISIDREQRITLFNDGAQRIFGHSRDEMIGKPLDLLIPDRFRSAHTGHVRGFGASATSARRMGERAEIFGLRKGGEEFAAEASISHLEIGGETIYTVVLRDISERKRAEALLARSHAELENRVSERTGELRAEMQRREETQALLVRAQRMEAFGQLTGGIAHDFNNLLTVVTGNLELLEMRLKDAKDQALLKRAQDAAEMGSRLTERLLTVARRRQFETRPINLNEHVIGMADLLRRTLGEPIDLTTRLAPKLWTVRADPSEVENAILNLAINARDAMPRGGQLTVETANLTLADGVAGHDRTLPAGDYVCLSVTDTGTGMTPEVLAHAFEPFYTTKQPGKGTGLGLSTLYGFVQQQGGTVTIASAPGQGTTVKVYLPKSDPDRTLMIADGSIDTVPVATGETVLLVEDNPGVREVTKDRILDLGYRVIDVENGPAALDVLQSGRPVDLVFSDVVMAGGMSGIDVARWVTSNRPALKMLLTSGYADDVLRAQHGHADAFRILRKPYTRKELARTLRDTLDA